MKYSFLILIASLLAISACKKSDKNDDEDNEVTVLFTDVTTGLEIDDPAGFLYTVRWDAENGVHDVYTYLHPVGDETNRLVDFTDHPHVNGLLQAFPVDLSAFNSDDCFKIRAGGCGNDDCTTATWKEIEVCIK